MASEELDELRKGVAISSSQIDEDALRLAPNDFIPTSRVCLDEIGETRMFEWLVITFACFLNGFWPTQKGLSKGSASYNIL